MAKRSSFEDFEGGGFEGSEASAEPKVERGPETLSNISFVPITKPDGTVVGYKDSRFGRKAVELIDPSNRVFIRPGATYEVRVLEDTDPGNPLNGKYRVEVIREEDEVKHKEAMLAKAERFRENPTFRTLAQIVNGDPDLSNEYRMVTERAREFKEDQEGEEKHRMYSPMLSALASSERGSELLELTIDRTTERDSEFIREQIKEGNNFVPEVVIGSGVHGTIWNVTRQMYLPENPALTVERDPKIGGQFAQYGRPLFRKNDRMRPELRDQPYLPGTAQALTTFSQFAPIQQADMGHEAYPFQDVTATSARINMFLSGRALTDAELLSVNLNPDQPEANPDDLLRKEQLLLEMKDRKTGRIEEVVTERLVFTSGIGEEVTKLDEKDEETREILQKAKQEFEEGKDVKAMSSGMLYQRTGNPAEPFPLKGYKRIILSGSGDSAIVTAGILLGYEGQVGKTAAQLDRVEEIIWLGPNFMTKEEFIEKARARYHWVGLDFPREDFEDYYHRIRPIPDVKASRLEMVGDNIRVICKEDKAEETPTSARGRPKKQEIAYQGDHYIYCHGFEDKTDKLVNKINNTVVTNEETLAQLRLTSPTGLGGDFFRRIDSQIYYKSGKIKKLEVINVENDEKTGTTTTTYRLIDRKGNFREDTITFKQSVFNRSLKVPKELVDTSNFSRVELGNQGNLSAVRVSDPESVNDRAIGTRYVNPFGTRSFDIFKAGPASRLPLTEEEKAQAPVLAEIPENTAAIFRYAPYTQALARACAEVDARKSRKAKGIFEVKENPEKDEETVVAMKAKTLIPNFTTVIRETDITERLPYDMSSLDALRLAVGDQLFNSRFPDDLKTIEFDIVKKTGQAKGKGIQYEIKSDPALPVETIDTFSSVFSDQLVGNILNKLTEKNSNRNEAIQLTLPVHQGKLDAANIRYTTLRK